MNGPRVSVGSRVHVADEYYKGPVLILEVGGNPNHELDRPWYCHLLDLCDHEVCGDEVDEICFGEECRGWYGPRDVLVPAEG